METRPCPRCGANMVRQRPDEKPNDSFAVNPMVCGCGFWETNSQYRDRLIKEDAQRRWREANPGRVNNE